MGPGLEPKIIGPEGGTLSFASGVITLVFPPGAVSEDVPITVEPASVIPERSRVVEGTVYEFQPAGTEFAKLVQLTVTYAPAAVPPGVREGELRLFELSGGRWAEIPGSGIDIAKQEVAAPIDGFSVFGVLAVPVASLAVSPDTATISVGEALQLTATARDSSGAALPSRPIVWASSDSGVATVDQAGSVTGVAPGAATITATSEGEAGTARVSVVDGFLALELVAGGLNDPVFVTAPPGDAGRLFVIERSGRILIVRGSDLLPTPFLDVRSLVSVANDGGLLSMAFHPEYPQTGAFFVHYTGVNDETRVVRYRVSGDPDAADPGSAEVILAVAPPRPAIHAGGAMGFGPDGMLYIGLGDGGLAANAQDLGNLFGTILRIDVDGGTPYAVPDDNPFVGVSGARDEIWAYGLRQPFRFSFDRERGDLYIGDVGESRWEEVNVQPATSGGGANYGWPVMEGAHCVDAAACDTTGMVPPVLEYSHAEGAVVIGGYVYGGPTIPLLAGRYLYADHGRGWVRSFRYEAGQAVDLQDQSADLKLPAWAISSFGEDAQGELYLTILTTPDEAGKVYRIAPGPRCCGSPQPPPARGDLR